MNLHHNFQRSKKGIGTIFAMIFFLIIVMVVFSSFVIILTQNTGLEQTTIQAKQTDLDRYTELTTVSITNPQVAILNNVVYISCTVSNTGTLPTELVRLWIKDNTTDIVGNTIISPSLILQPGSSIQYFNSTHIDNAGLLDQFSFWFISTRGNTISAFPNTNQLNGILPVGTFPGVTDINSTYQTDQNHPMQLSLNTTKVNQLIYVIVSFDDGNTLYTPTSTPSLTWSVRGTSLPTDGSESYPSSGHSGDSILKTFYAIKPTIGLITINIHSTADELSDYYCSALAFAISDVNTASPFDGSAQTTIGRSVMPQDTINVHNSNELIIGAIGIDALNPAITPGAGFGEIMPVQSSFGASGEANSMPRSVWSEWAIMGDPRNNLPVNCTFSFSEDWAIIVDAVKLVVVPPIAPMSLSPNTGPTGQPVTVSGQGFAANSQLLLTFDGSQVPFSFTTDSTGKIPSGAIFTVPQGSTAGVKTVDIIDSEFNYASADFTVTIPSITVTPQTGSVGTTVAVTGSNFIDNSNIAINFGGNPIVTNPSTVKATATGDFSATFVVSGTSGLKQVWVSDGVNNVVSNFNIFSSITVDPLSGLNGDKARLSGNGFAANSSFVVTFDGTTVTIPPENAVTDGEGVFSNLLITTQSSGLGAKIINVTDASNNFATTQFNIIQTNANISASTFVPSGSITLGSSVTVSVSITAPLGISIPPTGNVQFQVKIGAGSFANFGSPVALSNGLASISYSPQSIGTYRFQALYQGDSNYYSGTSATSETLTVYVPSSTVTLLSASSPITLGGTTTDTATVIPQTYLSSQVTFLGSGAGVSGSSTSLNVAYPTGLAVNDLLLLQVTVRDTSSSAPTTPAGWAILYGPDSPSLGAASRQWIFSKFAVGSESGSLSMLGFSGSNLKIARMYAFRNVAISSFNENGGFISGSSTTISAQQVATNGYGRLAVSFVFDTSNTALNEFSGESGGNWVEAVPEYAVTNGGVQLQIATMALGGTVSGGSFTTGTSTSWGVRGFALVPSPALPTGSIGFQVLAPGGSWATYNTQILTSGTAISASYTPVIAGTWYFRAVYAGDSNYVGSQSGDTDESLDVNSATAAVGAASFVPVSPITLGTAVTVSASVAGPSGVTVPSGLVQFQVSINSGAYANFGSLATLSSGSASVSYIAQALGTYQFRAVYQGDSNYIAGTTGAASGVLTVKGIATVSVSSFVPASPIALGTGVTVSASVSAPSGIIENPTGNIQFMVKIGGGSYANFGSPVAISGGSASISYTPSTVNTYNFQAVYLGDSNYVSGTTGAASGTLNVNKLTATVGAASFVPVSPITLGTAVTVSASVSGPGGGVTAPSGTVQFQVSINGGAYANFGSAVALSSGSASIIYTPATATTYRFQAVYQGDINYVAGTTGATSGTLTVNKGAATVNTPSLNPSASISYGGSITCSVTVLGVSGGATPTGNVQFQYSTDSGSSWSNLGSAVALSGGSATSSSYKPTSSGNNYRFRVSTYSGDTNYIDVSVPTLAVTLTVTHSQVSFVNAGAGSASLTNPTPTYPNSLQSGDLVLLQVTVMDVSTTPTTPAGGWAVLYGPDQTGTNDGDRGRQWIYYRFSDGTESGNSVTITIGGSEIKLAQMYAFRNVALNSFNQGGSFFAENDDTINPPSVTTSVDKELAVAFTFVVDNQNPGAFTGGSGGTWTLPTNPFGTSTGDEGCLQLQTATIATAGTVTSGATYDMGFTNYYYGVRTFALIPR